MRMNIGLTLRDRVLMIHTSLTAVEGICFFQHPSSQANPLSLRSEFSRRSAIGVGRYARNDASNHAVSATDQHASLSVVESHSRDRHSAQLAGIPKLIFWPCATRAIFRIANRREMENRNSSGNVLVPGWPL